MNRFSLNTEQNACITMRKLSCRGPEPNRKEPVTWFEKKAMTGISEIVFNAYDIELNIEIKSGWILLNSTLKFTSGIGT